jgi:D-alanyl-D-alanine dipeptidase
MKQVTSWLVLASCSAMAPAANAKELLADCRQCLVVTTDSWSSQTGTMFLYERDAGSPWHQIRSKISVVVGKTGLAWGRGLFPTEPMPGPVKREGDNKAPAGVFQLGPVFGYASETPPTKMPYLALTKTIVGVDDPQSEHYNTLVDQSKIQAPDWRTSEKMRRDDDLYKWGVVVNHNMPAHPAAGSCIFLHVWRNSATGTAGCTAMSEQDLLRVIGWLDPDRNPLLVQMPRPLYEQLRAQWKLPPGSNTGGSGNRASNKSKKIRLR